MKDRLLSAGHLPHVQAQPFTTQRVALAAAFTLLSLTPAASWALGLGRLSVQSSLGEPLRAEIDVTAITPDEAASLQARVAAPDTYRAAGVDYNPVLGVTAISLQRRADGRSFLKLTSDRAVTEPFVDAILDLSWSSGRLVREYTLLFDPPAAKPAAAPLTAPVMDAPSVARPKAPPPVAPAAEPAVPVAKAPALPPTPTATATPSTPPTPASAPAAAAKPLREARPAGAPAAPALPATGAADAAIRVRSGDSLSRIAERTQPPGVSLDQMIVGLYRANPEAFQAQNMNRLRSGVVLNVPAAEQAKSVSRAEARQIIVAQSADFAAFRQRVAAGVTESTQAAPRQQASGKVQTEVQDKRQGAVPAPDKLTLSKGGVAAGAGAEDRLAKARAAQDEKARAGELSRNLDELKRLKEQASASKPAASVAAPLPRPVAPAPSAASVAKAAPASQPASVAAPAVPAALVASAAAVPPSAPASVADAASGTAMASVDQASAPASRPVPQAIALPASAPVPDEPDFLGSLNLPLLGGAGAVLAALAGLGLYLRSRRKPDSAETSFLESRLQPDSFFGASGGQRVDTRDASGGPSSMSYSLSQLDAIGDVDPVAEADVYLAYGRDLQAEEILKEAMRINPDRLAIRAKLAEVYAKRRDTKGFEQLAQQIHAASGGVGEDWTRVQEMGLSIDPENPLYQPGGQPMEVPAPEPARFDALGASTMPLSEMPSLQSEPVVAAPSGLDLDITAMGEAIAPQPEVGEPELFTLDMPGSEAPSVAPLPVAEAAVEELDFELPLDEAPVASSEVKPLEFDLAGISLDLGEPGAAPAAPGSAVPEGLGADASVTDLPELEAPEDPLARKLELAEEFLHIGDVDGARELLEEVVATADDATRAKAQGMLDDLS